MTTPLFDRLRDALRATYALERELGGGGMSRVFVAEDRALGRRVVIKVLHPDLASGVNGERFRREILLAAQLQHPHVVPVLGAGELDGLPYFVMPFVAGQSLRERLDGEHGLPLAEAVAILRDVARALAFAHAQGVVHRDVKPENVLLSGGSAAVTDFGIAKALSTSRTGPGHEGTLTSVGTSLGTPAYMAPEQIAADPATDHRADLYAFGVMAYELLAGRPPFHGRAPQALLAAHLAEAPPPLAERAPGAPQALAALVMRCLAKSPAERPASAGAVVDALDRLDVSGGHATVDLAAVRAPAARRPRRLVPLLAVGTVAAAAIGFGTWRRFSEATPVVDDAVVAVAPFRVASADPALHYLREGMLDLLSAKLTGEGGLRATEPRVFLTAWHRAGGDGETDLEPDAAAGVARRLSAGRLLLGDVVGTPSRVVLNASLLDSEEGTTVARVSVEGPPDSLAGLVDQLAARLLTAVSGEPDPQLAALGGTSLPALRAYLDGQAKLRDADAAGAVEDFGRALAVDSTFALAGLGLRLAASWNGDNQQSERGVRLAWLGRDRLSGRERTLLEAVAGPRYPAPSSTAEQFAARERYLRLAPDRADAWVLYADDLFHYGSVLGVEDHLRASLDGFRRALELDSSYAVPFGHVLILATSLRDTALERRVVRLASALPDTVQRFTLSPWRWLRATLDGDSAVLRAYRDSVADSTLPWFHNRYIDQANLDGTGAADAWYGVQTRIAAAGSRGADRWLHNLAHSLALELGRPAAAQRHLELGIDSAYPHNAWLLAVRAATFGPYDTAAVRRAVAALAPLEEGPPGDSTGREIQRAVLRAMEPWRLSHGDTTRTRRTLERLRALARVDSSQAAERAVEIALIETMHAHRTAPGDRARLRAQAERLDSLLLAVDYRTTHYGRTALANLVAARAFETLGDYERAWRAARRRQKWMTQDMAYLAHQLREEGRLAALAGERAEAERAYRHYLALRHEPEPAMRAEAEEVRRELAKLAGEAK
jgi:serine/threonine-protein kinase